MLNNNDLNIKLFVGLGNPGDNYKNTRHNAGFWLLEQLSNKHGFKFKFEPKFKSYIYQSSNKCILLMPQTFMNLSGEAVSSVARFYKINVESILVAHDELAFSPGVIRLKKGGGTNGHNGLNNIITALKSNNFWRLRIGIGKSVFAEILSDYVISTPSASEKQEIDNAINEITPFVFSLISNET